MANIKLFEEKQVHIQWDEKEQLGYFSTVDVVEVLTSSCNRKDYWFKMNQRVKTEDDLELKIICRQLKLKATDGKMRAINRPDWLFKTAAHHHRPHILKP